MERFNFWYYIILVSNNILKKIFLLLLRTRFCLRKLPDLWETSILMFPKPAENWQHLWKGSYTHKEWFSCFSLGIPLEFLRLLFHMNQRWQMPKKNVKINNLEILCHLHVLCVFFYSSIPFNLVKTFSSKLLAST